MVDDTRETAKYDYVSPGLERVDATALFPNMIEGDPDLVPWSHMRKADPHKWYCDRRSPGCGFVNVDEAHIIYNTALMFGGLRGLEIGCWMGWSAWHILRAGVRLDIVDPAFANVDLFRDVARTLCSAGQLLQTSSLPSPSGVKALALRTGEPWSFFFIDGDHDAPHPMLDAAICDHYAARDALILFHDVLCPDVFDAVRFLRWRGWKTKLYYTSQMMAAAYRGAARPIDHTPDAKIVDLILPNQLALATLDAFSEWGEYDV